MESVGVSRLFNGAYSGKKVFITGITGFKGSWLAVMLESIGAKVSGFALAPRTSDDHFHFLELEKHTHIGDILDQRALQAALTKEAPEVIFHLAAQPLVRTSYADPVYTYQANVMGSLQVYEAARMCASVSTLVSITTDKVYENHEQGKPYSENDPLGGHDPYSSSKACVEILTQSYRKSFLEPTPGAMLLATARAGNVIGGGDWAEDRLVPDLIRATRDGLELKTRNPKSIRPWQHVLEPLTGYLHLGQRLIEKDKKFADAFNFGPNSADSCTVEEVLKKFQSRWNQVRYRFETDASAPHEAGILKLDSTKCRQHLGWRSVLNLDDAVSMTIDWYKEYIRNKKVITREQVESYWEKLK